MTPRSELTVAAVVERDGQFLLVEEHVGQCLVLNQPAGHVERGEPFIAAVVRETLEETAWTFRPQAVVGIYHWEHPQQQRSFLRVAFCGEVSKHDPSRRLDQGIERTLWLSREQLVGRVAALRSPMVLDCIDDYLAGARHPLHVIRQVLRDLPAPDTAQCPERPAQQHPLSRLL